MLLYYMGLLETLEADKTHWKCDELYLEKVWDTMRALIIKVWLLLHLWELFIWKPIWLLCNMIYDSTTNSQHIVTGENPATYSPAQNLHTAPCFLPIGVLVHTCEIAGTEKYMDPVGCPI